MTDKKPILCLDFDGVCHLYTSGWKGADVVSDPPVPGLFEFIESVAPHFEINVFSSRSHQPGGIAAMIKWFDRQWEIYLDAYGRHYVNRPFIRFPSNKPAAMVSIDDRALTFTGVWPALEQLQSFKPWNKS